MNTTHNHYFVTTSFGAKCSAGDWGIIQPFPPDPKEARDGFVEHLHEVIEEHPQDGFMVPAAPAEVLA